MQRVVLVVTKRPTVTTLSVSDLGTVAALFDEADYYSQVRVECEQHGISALYPMTGLPATCLLELSRDGYYLISLEVLNRVTGDVVAKSEQLIEALDAETFQHFRTAELCVFSGDRLSYRRRQMLLDQARFELAVSNPVGFNKYLNGSFLR